MTIILEWAYYLYELVFVSVLSILDFANVIDKNSLFSKYDSLYRVHKFTFEDVKIDDDLNIDDVGVIHWTEDGKGKTAVGEGVRKVLLSIIKQFKISTQGFIWHPQHRRLELEGGLSELSDERFEITYWARRSFNLLLLVVVFLIAWRLGLRIFVTQIYRFLTETWRKRTKS